MTHDLVLQAGLVYDGLGSPAQTADVAIRGDRVVAVGHDLGEAKRVIDVDGLAVAPGFIDPHAHSDMIPLLPEPQPFKLQQGVTTEIVGNCGFSFAPLHDDAMHEVRESFGELSGGTEVRAGTFADHLERLAEAGPTNHIASLVGHNALRLSANGMDQALRPGALEEMCRLLDESFAAGAVGLSTGLIYVPGAFSDTDEIVALAQTAHRWQRPYTSHMRDEGVALGEALDEAIEIGRRARVRVQVSHCKAAGAVSHGRSQLLLDKLRAARIDGVDIRGDQYPYLAGSTLLSALLPPVAQEGGVDELRRRLADPSERQRLRTRAEDTTAPVGAGLWAQATPDDVLIIRHANRAHQGKTLRVVVGERDAWEVDAWEVDAWEVDAWEVDAWEVLCDLVRDDPSSMMVVTLMDETDVRAIMADPLIGIGSDSGIPEGLEHPRTWGCFPRFLGTYVRELGVVDWPEAIRKVSSSTAAQFGLVGRGWLGPGAVADVCVFDPATVGHRGSYLEPAAAPDGIRHVVLAGAVVIDDGSFSGERRGQVLRAGASPL